MYRPVLMFALVHALAASPLLAQTSAQTDLGRTTPIEHARVVLERVDGLAIGARIAAFNLGSEEKIEAGDANALLAIQALAGRVRAFEEKNASLRNSVLHSNIQQNPIRSVLFF